MQLTTAEAEVEIDVDGPAAAPALLLCNSLGTTLDLWDQQVARLGDRFRIVRFNTRGHGRSSAPAGDYSIAQLGNDAVAVLDSIGLDRVDVAGVSLGGLVALQLATAYPERVRRLVLANTAARVGTASKWQERIDAVRAAGMGAIRDAVLQRFFSEQFRRERPDVVETFRRRLEATDAAGYVGCCAALRDADLRPAAATVTAPTLVIAGASDAATPPSDGEWLAAHIPSSRLAVLEAAHLSNVERADEFSALMLSFLTD